MRGRSNFTDFVKNFNAAYDTGSKVAQDLETAQVARATPEQSQGFTQEQGQQLQAAADSGQYDVGTFQSTPAIAGGRCPSRASCCFVSHIFVFAQTCQKATAKSPDSHHRRKENTYKTTSCEVREPLLDLSITSGSRF